MNSPKVSIIIVAYNAESTISRCLESVIKQTYKDFEVICVNDGSTDKTEEIIKKYAENDERIKLISEENSGPAKARSLAFNYINGKYVVFVDADDYIEYDMLETMYNTIEKENVDIVMCNARAIDYATGKEIQNDYTKLSLKGYRDLTPNDLNYINVLLWNKIFKKEIVDKYEITYPDKYEHDDTVFFYKYIIHCKNFYGVDKKLYNYVKKNPNSIMGQVSNRKNFGREFDFILCWQNLYDYFEKYKPNDEYLDVIINITFGHILEFYNMLHSKKQKEGFKLIKDLVNKNDILLRHKAFKKIKRARLFSSFERILTDVYDKCSFLENFFSVRNNFKHTHKIVRIFGIKFIFKRALKEG